MSNTSLSRTSGPQGGRQVWGRKNEEFIADFIAIARRTLGDKTFEFTLFRYHYLLGADEKLLMWQLRIDRDTFFNARERIIQKLGKAYRETEPFSLYPIDEYFSSRVDRSGVVAAELSLLPPFVPVRAPLATTPQSHVRIPVEERFSDAEVMHIRSVDKSSQALADEYGVSQMTINNVRTGRRFGHLPGQLEYNHHSRGWTTPGTVPKVA